MEIYTELRAAFRDASDPAENCSAETWGRFARKFRGVNFREVVQHGIITENVVLVLYVIPRG